MSARQRDAGQDCGDGLGGGAKVGWRSAQLDCRVRGECSPISRQMKCGDAAMLSRANLLGKLAGGGFGMVVDRLAMLLLNKHSIREVLLFPALRKEE